MQMIFLILYKGKIEISNMLTIVFLLPNPLPSWCWVIPLLASSCCSYSIDAHPGFDRGGLYELASAAKKRPQGTPTVALEAAGRGHEVQGADHGGGTAPDDWVPSRMWSDTATGLQ